MAACVYQEGVTLCDARQMSLSTNPCVGQTKNVTIRDCATKRQSQYFSDNIIQTPNSLVVCTPKTNVTVFKSDIMGIIHTSVQTIPHPRLFTAQDADFLLINYHHYPISNVGPSINISSIYHYHPNPEESSDLDHIHGVYDNSSFAPIQPLQIYSSFHIGFYTIITLALIAIIVVGYLLNRKYKQSDSITQKRIGLVAYKVHHPSNIELSPIRKVSV